MKCRIRVGDKYVGLVCIPMPSIKKWEWSDWKLILTDKNSADCLSCYKENEPHWLAIAKAFWGQAEIEDE